MNNVLIVYYSYTGNTRIVANKIQKALNGADILEITMEYPYSTDYDTTERQSRKEIQEGFRPLITTKCENLDEYNYVIIATPNWFNTMAPCVATFLESYNWAGKKILPVCTNGGGGIGHVVSDIKKLCSGAEIKETLVLYNEGGAGVENKISAWLHNNLD